MRPSVLFLLAATLATAPLVRAADLPDFATASAAAKKSNKPLLVLADGPGYAPDSAAVRAGFAAELARRGFPVVAGIHNYEQAAPGEKPASQDKGRAPESAPWNLPALIVAGPDGRTFAVAEGLRADTVAGVIARVPAVLENMAKRDAFWAKAGAAKGAERAILLGSGLDMMPGEQARNRKDILAEMRKADPKDTSGYVFKYTFDASAWHESEVDKAIAANRGDAMLAEIDTRLANPRLTPEQKQLLLTGRFQVHFRADRLPQALQALDAIVAIGPESDMGRGAAAYRRQLTDPVRLPALAWRQTDNRPVFLPMIADVSSVVNAKGAYEVEFRHTSGHTRFAKTEFVVDGKVVASDENKKESRKVRLVLAAKPSGRVELRVLSRGTGWFDGAGDIVVTRPAE